jgi:hypothetical protein
MRQAIDDKTVSRSKPENIPLPRAVILHNHQEKSQTVGFPALDRTKLKIVRFATPLSTRCMSIDGVWSIDCLVLSVWDTGAQLQVRQSGHLTEFYLVFTSSLIRPVSRRCKKISTYGDMIEVAYQREQSAFLLKWSQGS